MNLEQFFDCVDDFVDGKKSVTDLVNAYDALPQHAARDLVEEHATKVLRRAEELIGFEKAYRRPQPEPGGERKQMPKAPYEPQFAKHKKALEDAVYDLRQATQCPRVLGPDEPDIS